MYKGQHHYSFEDGDMTTTPDSPEPSQGEGHDPADPGSKKAPGAEIGMSPPGEGSTFEPEEDPDTQG